MGSEDNFIMENDHKCGKLELIIGNMFSGKSTELIRRINKTKIICDKIMVINHSSDIRNDNDVISTHDNKTLNCIKLSNLSEFDTNFINNFDYFFIDEAQFFPDLYSFVSELVDTYKKNVIVCGLDGDIYRNSFGEIHKLIPICDTIDKLTAYCTKCNNGRIAPFTKKKNSNDNTDVIDIGGSDKYIAVCRYHYFT